ncbi:hypothetical protein ACFVH6_36070 [Spirillospora sp. NPDC127200]
METKMMRRGNCLRPKRVYAYWSAAVCAAVFVSGCDNGSSGTLSQQTRDSKELPPGVSDTGARLPNPCQLVDEKTARYLIGEFSGTPTSDEQTPSSAECVWKPKEVKAPSAFIRVSAIIQKKTVKGGDPFSFAKGNFQTLSSGDFCRELKINADETCWKEEEDGFAVIARKGYVVIQLTYGGIKSKTYPKKKLPAIAKDMGSFAVEQIK